MAEFKHRWGVPRLVVGTLSVLTLVFLTGAKGCPAFNKVFPHKVHMEEAKLKCTDCHSGAEKEEKATMPSPDSCKDCHELSDKQLAVVAELLKEKTFAWPATDLLYGDELIFSHQKHADAKIECSACHGDMAKNKTVSADNLPRMESCVACHEDKKIANECATCHKEIRQDVKPLSHQLGWEWSHGQQVEHHGFTGDGDTAACSRCHTTSSCTQCHQKEPPRNHNNFFKQRGHGIDASVDRSNCATCHQTSFCIRCHQENTPVSHMGGWGEPLNQHCVSCHQGQSTNNCTVCHRDPANHVNVAPRLPSVVPAHAFNNTCLTCHGVGANAVRHPTNGGDGAYCRSCHQ